MKDGEGEEGSSQHGEEMDQTEKVFLEGGLAGNREK